MKPVALFSFIFVGLAIVEGHRPIEPKQLAKNQTPSVPQLAERCNEELCKLPDCRCSSFRIPGDLLPKDTPQFVTITFDNGVNIRNIETYRKVLYGRRNSDACPAGATFYVTHEYSNYHLINELYNQGFEIALKSMTHKVPQDYWATATYNVIKEEIADQRLQMSHFANIPIESIKGVRLPFLQMSGNNSFQVMADYGLEYDCSWVETVHRNPLWPYTLDYASIQFCVRPPCPTASIPKVWVQPIVPWIDQKGTPCAMVESCYFTPNLGDEEGWFQFIVTNFERHYLVNRAPFGFYVSEWYLDTNPYVKAAFIRFMDYISSLSDVFMVNSSEVIDWIKNPIPVSEYRTKGCRTWIATSCRARYCGPLDAAHNENLRYYHVSCHTAFCPRVYPWTGNPLGL